MRSLYSLISTGTELMKVGESKLSLVGKATSPARPGEEGARRRPAAGRAHHLQEGDEPAGLLLALGLLAGRCRRGGRDREPRSSRSASSWRARETSLRSTPRSTGCRPISAWRCPTVFRPSWPPSPPWVRSPCRAFVRAMCRSGTRRASSAWAWSGSWSSSCSVASGVQVVGLDPDQDRCRLAEKAGALLCTAPDDEGCAAVEQASRRRREVSVPTGCSWWRAALPTSRSNWRLASRATGQRSSTSASASWICPGTTITRRSSTFGSPARTDRAAMTPDTNWTASTTRWATYDGRSAAIFTASSTPWPERKSIPSHSSQGSFPSRTRRTSTSNSAPGCCRGRFSLRVRLAGREPTLASCERAADARIRPRRDDGIDTLRAARRSENQNGARADRVRRRRQLCLVHAASPSREGARGRPGTACATRRSLSAVNAQRKFGFRECRHGHWMPSSRIRSIDAVFIVTRHSSHADLTCRALEAGKAVFVEKPLALTLDELERILATVDATGNDRVMVGFNRRFAPLLVEMRQRFGRVIRADKRPVPRQCRTPRVGQLVSGQRSSRALGSSARVGTSWTPSAGGSAATQWRSWRWLPAGATRCR